MYTHEFEFYFDGIQLEGEMLLDGKTMIKVNSGAEMTIDQHAKVQQLFEVIERVACTCTNGGVIKIEITKK